MEFVLTETTIGGLRILEPVTSLTDLITALVCFFAYFSLRKLHRTEAVHKYFTYYFLFMGVTTMVAATVGHAFLYAFGFSYKMIGWTFSSIGIFCIQAHSIISLKPYVSQGFFRGLWVFIILQWVAFMSTIITLTLVMGSEKGFEFVQMNSALGLSLFTLPIQAWLYLKERNPARGMVALAIILGIIPAIVYRSEFTIHAYLNYHDISHLLMATIMFTLYRAAYGLQQSSNDDTRYLSLG
ncbi:DUF6962 family protein [Pontibacter sp. G13]|uniref:DUF6962 family protein n=1 Tax=Pontibacter sp. G13 TaxID=3074898 RepID=UPI0028898AC3|nr:hypothetical protein [Pontibacter sp. G13]WNJ19283.1 hypothetical protein RJD25_02225 [Pontibacter sp. G13]